jgi:nucleoside-diphosphate-sugar epimerase
MFNTSNLLPGLRLIITGANGFLGSEILRQAVAERFSARATDKDPEAPIANVDYLPVDILDLPKLNSVFRGMNNVIHAAGLAHIFGKTKAAKARFRLANEIGTANSVQAAADSGSRHFVLISSVSVYGGSRNGGAEDSGCYPQGPYAESKYQAEQRAIEIAKASGMALTILRLPTLFGEGDPGNVARLIRTIDCGRFVWIGSGSNRKCLLHREDAARACLAVIQRPASGVVVYNVGARPCTMREVVEGLAGALGKRIPSFSIPAALIREISGLLTELPMSRLQTLGATAQKWLGDDVYDGRKFTRAFNFQARVNLADGLHREVAWYRAEQTKRGG